jgi:hypothetical protein
MAQLVYTDAMVFINGIDLSNHVRQLTLTYEAEMLDNTAMGTSGTRSTLFPLIGAAAFPIRVKPVNASAISATNPEYQGNAVLESYPPLTGEVGALAMCSAQFRAGGGSALVRDITP